MSVIFFILALASLDLVVRGDKSFLRQLWNGIQTKKESKKEFESSIGGKRG